MWWRRTARGGGDEGDRWLPEGASGRLFYRGPDAGDVHSACELVERMHRDPALRHERICVEVQNGVAILDGQVSSPAARTAAGVAAWCTPGVRDVSNRLRP